MKIEVIQFMLPDGRQVIREIEIPEELDTQYMAMKECGCRLTCEMLSDFDVSVAIEHEEGDYDIEVVTNYPGLPMTTVSQMLRRFKVKEFKRWLKNIS
jgi:hypothetical protein